MITVQYIMTSFWDSEGSQFYLENPFWSHLSSFSNILLVPDNWVVYLTHVGMYFVRITPATLSVNTNRCFKANYFVY